LNNATRNISAGLCRDGPSGPPGQARQPRGAVRPASASVRTSRAIAGQRRSRPGGEDGKIDVLQGDPRSVARFRSPGGLYQPGFATCQTPSLPSPVMSPGFESPS
jgi:hypothetical protein